MSSAKCDDINLVADTVAAAFSDSGSCSTQATHNTFEDKSFTVAINGRATGHQLYGQFKQQPNQPINQSIYLANCATKYKK